MSAPLDSQRLGAIFQARPDILDGIKRAADSPGRVALFNEIASHIFDQYHLEDQPAHKKRRVDVGQPGAAVNGSSKKSNAADETVLLEIKEISVSVPQRKKFELCFTANHIYARAPNTTTPVQGISHAWSDIEYAFCLPVPEKTQVQHNYLLFPKGTYLPSKTNPPTVEPLVFTIPATPPKQGTIGGTDAGNAAAVSDSYKTLFHWALSRHLKTAGNNVEIVSANPNKFHSMVRQPHRPNEKAVHVKAFRGSKDGYLFFLENGILWGFKKPLMFIPLNRIVATSYTSVLQRTFNMVVEVFAGEGDETEELEFSMLDQEDYGGIDDYVKQNRLQDRSMAEQRKAKLELAENRGPKKGANGAEADGDTAGNVGEDGMTELERAHVEAEQQLQDEEDEDEEDYDPGSDGESEGSGESSEEDDDDDDDEGDGEEEGEEGGEEYDEEGGEEEGEEEEEEAEEEEEEEAEEEEEPAPAPAPAPVRGGWATMNSRPSNAMDVDEAFDVVG